MGSMVIVNADDFGESEKANHGIIACFDAGVVSNTTILANMPGFDEAVQLAHDKKIVSRVGIHINIMDGQPLTNKIKYLPRFCNSHGLFAYQRLQNFHFSQDEKSALRDEIASQIEKCRSGGFSLSHADSHLHVHTELPVFHIIAPVLKFYNIRNLRIASNIETKRLIKKTYKSIFNQFVRYKKFNCTDFFGDMNDFKQLNDQSLTVDHSVELMVHPYIDDKGEVIDVLDHLPLIKRLEVLLNGCELGHYPLKKGNSRLSIKLLINK